MSKYKTYYAGNGRLLVGFDTAAERDDFVRTASGFIAEKSSDVLGYGGLNAYPQAFQAKSEHGPLFAPNGQKVFL